ncbi:MAG: hypothetical protein B6242_06690 [Anaerolineaceae bacterium 4572_78]|nr:MAG: hypothetical protein B6242_06690 [Anaerolineaceae bacterium 4572_78]
MVVGIIGVEWYRNENWEEAWQATKGYCTGATIGMLAKLVTGITMFGVFTVSVLFM